MREVKSKLIIQTSNAITSKQRRIQKSNKMRKNRLKNETNLDLKLFSKKLRSRNPELICEKVSFNDLIEFILDSQDEIQLFYLIKALSKVLADSDSFFNEDFDDEVLEILLKKIDNPRFSCVVLDCLINLSVCNGQSLVNLDCLSRVIHLASLSVDEDILDKSLWVLANIASDSIDFRNEIIELKGLKLCLAGLSNENTLKNALFCISNLCRGRPSVPESISKKIVKKVAVFFSSKNEELLKSLCEIVFSCSINPNFKFPNIFPVDTLINMTKNPSFSLICLKILNNFLFSDENFAKYLIENGFLDQISKFLESNDWEKTEALLMMVNFSSGGPEILEKIGKSLAFRKILELIKSTNFDIKLDALNVIQRVSTCNAGLSVLITGKGLGLVVECFKDPHPDVITTVLKILQLVLALPKGKQYFKKLEGLKRLQILRNHPNKIVPEMIKDLIQTHNFDA